MPNLLLSPGLLRQLEQFQLTANRRAKSSARGERRSRARGQSVEFADYRNYAVGDDFRYLDWNTYGRLEKLFVKLYEEERELPVHIFLDASESMTFGTPSKFSFACRLAAAIGYVALCGFDRVTVTVFPQLAAEPLARSALSRVRGKKSALKFFEHLSQLRAGGEARLNAALRRGALEAARTGSAIVLSDFLDPEGYEGGLLSLVARGFHIQAIQILSGEELAPAVFGDLRLVDAETGTFQEVTFGRYRMAAYQQTVSNFCQRLREFCQSHGIGFFLANSAKPLEDLLLKEFRRAEVWK